MWSRIQKNKIDFELQSSVNFYQQNMSNSISIDKFISKSIFYSQPHKMCVILTILKLCETDNDNCTNIWIKFQMHEWLFWSEKKKTSWYQTWNKKSILLFWFELLELFQRCLEYIRFYYCDWKYRWCSYYRIYRKFLPNDASVISLNKLNFEVNKNSQLFY